MIDTAYLFEREGSKTDSPSLREIAKHVLNVSLPEVHDSVRDAGMCIYKYINRLAGWFVHNFMYIFIRLYVCLFI